MWFCPVCPFLSFWIRPIGKGVFIIIFGFIVNFLAFKVKLGIEGFQADWTFIVFHCTLCIWIFSVAALFIEARTKGAVFTEYCLAMLTSKRIYRNVRVVLFWAFFDSSTFTIFCRFIFVTWQIFNRLVFRLLFMPLLAKIITVIVVAIDWAMVHFASVLFVFFKFIETILFCFRVKILFFFTLITFFFSSTFACFGTESPSFLALYPRPEQWTSVEAFVTVNAHKGLFAPIFCSGCFEQWGLRHSVEHAIVAIFISRFLNPWVKLSITTIFLSSCFYFSIIKSVESICYLSLLDIHIIFIVDVLLRIL